MNNMDITGQGVLRVHPGNRRYFTNDTGRAIYLTGSHTWAARQERGIEGVTPDFDFPAFIRFMADHGHNFLRLWAWEHAQWMQFAPADRLIRYEPLPFERTGPGEALDGKPKFDLTRPDKAYFARLRERVQIAGRAGIHVAVMLFQGFSVEQKHKPGVDPKLGNPWDGHPFHRENNINGIDGDPQRTGEGMGTHQLQTPRVTAAQEAYVRWTIEALNDLGHIVWEIGNECHSATMPWQEHIAAYIRRVEAGMPRQHLVGMTGAPIKTATLLESSADWISPFGNNAFYSDPPAADGGKIWVHDTDHGAPRGTDATWPWRAFLRGGHFITMDPYKDARIDSPREPEPKWEGIRRAMGQTRKFAESLDLAPLLPRPELASTGYCLAHPGDEYLVYEPATKGAPFTVTLDPGPYAIRWIDPNDLKVLESLTLTHRGDRPHSFQPPDRRSMLLHLRAEPPARGVRN